MARYIDADKFLESQIERCGGVMPIIGTCTMDNEALNWIVEQTPKADVVEVKHGYWVENDYRSFDGFETVVYPNEALKCSECSHNFKKELLWRKNYCPECGAKMDGERKCEDGEV